MGKVKLTKEEKKKHTPIQVAIKQAIKEKKVAVKKSTVELVQYTIKAVIPTGAYANIQPEITVKAKSLEEAEGYVIPHINKLFEDFLNKSERKTVVPTVTAKETPAPVTQAQKVESTKITVDGKPTGMTVPEKSVGAGINPVKTNEDIARLKFEQDKAKAEQPLHSIPYTKAKSAVDSCTSIEALTIIKNQVEKSSKLTDNEKNALLMVVIPAKEKSL